MLTAEMNTPAETSNEANYTLRLSPERRAHRRADMEDRGITVQRWDGNHRAAKAFGTLVDISAGGVRIRTDQQAIRADHQIRLRLELPEYAGISPFIDQGLKGMSPKRE